MNETILFLTHIYPYPPNDGGRIVSYNTIKSLSKRYNVILLSFYDQYQESKVEIEGVKQYLVKKDYNNKKVNLFKNIFSKTPYTMSKYIDKNMSDKLSFVLSKHNINSVILDHLHVAYYVDQIKKTNTNIKVHLRQHNVETMIMNRAAEKEKNTFKKSYLSVQGRKLFNYEKNIVGKMDSVITITDEDKDVLNSMNNHIKRIITVKAGVDFKRYIPMNKENLGTKNIVFLGAMNWLPNQNGVLWFVEKVLPDLLKENNDIKFYIVGKNPSKEIENIQKKYPSNVLVTGFVEDEREYISLSDVFIVPLLIGGGMRLKILNALAMKKAIVSTSIGAEGINIDNGYLIADSPREFRESILNLLNDKETRKQLETNGHIGVKDKYSFESVLQPLIDLIEEGLN